MNDTAYVLTEHDIEIMKQQALLADRNKFYAKLNRIGYIPDDDMRHQVESIKCELEKRIENLADHIIAIGG